MARILTVTAAVRQGRKPLTLGRPEGLSLCPLLSLLLPTEHMRILLLTDGIFPYVMGGMQKHSYYLAKFLAAEGVDVHVVHCTPEPVDEAGEPAFAGWGPGRVTFERQAFPAAGRWPGHYLRASRRYSSTIQAALHDRLAGFDLVYAQGFTAWAFLRAGTRAVPVVANLHGYEMFQAPPSWKATLGQPALRSLAREVSLGADAVFSFGGHITRILRGMGVPAARILECPIGVESNWTEGVAVRPGTGPRTFVFVGRDERRKGIAELNRALALLLAGNGPEFRFHFIGPIAARNRISAPGIVYHGGIKEEARIRDLLRASDVLVCPSFSEGMPTVIMEAMASGLAVIATDVGAVSQQVDSDNGWLLQRPVPAAIQAAMQAASELPEADLMRKKESALGKVRAQFTWERVIQRKKELLAGLAR